MTRPTSMRAWAALFRAFPAAAVLPLAAALACWGCSGRTSDSSTTTAAATLRESLPKVRLAASLPAGSREASFSTYLEAEREAELVAETDGAVTSIRVREGQRVAAGDTLIQIDDRDERLALERDEAERAWRLSRLARLQPLQAQNHVSAQEVEQARLEVRRAEAALGLSRVALSRCSVRAPIAGLAWMIRVQALHRVTVGQPLLRVTDPDRLRASAYLPASYRGTVRPGTRVRLAPAGGGAPIEAVVSRVDPLTDPASGTFRAIATFRRGAARLEAGSEARFVLPALSADAGCLVPANTLIEADADSAWIWEWAGDRVHRRLVRIGPVRREAIQIEAGLPAGARVVVGSDRPLSDGAVVEVVETR